MGQISVGERPVEVCSALGLFFFPPKTFADSRKDGFIEERQSSVFDNLKCPGRQVLESRTDKMRSC